MLVGYFVIIIIKNSLKYSRDLFERKGKKKKKCKFIQILYHFFFFFVGETATTSKEGSRRANYPILTQGGSDNK
jgi:hypothetical protein